MTNQLEGSLAQLQIPHKVQKEERIKRFWVIFFHLSKPVIRIIQVHEVMRADLW